MAQGEMIKKYKYADGSRNGTKGNLMKCVFCFTAMVLLSCFTLTSGNSLFGISDAHASSSTNLPIINVPSDRRATYRLISRNKHRSGHILIITMRNGPSGKSLAVRECSCSSTFRYLSEGDNQAELKRNIRTSARMSPLVRGSISYYVCQHACSR